MRTPSHEDASRGRPVGSPGPLADTGGHSTSGTNLYSAVRRMQSGGSPVVRDGPGPVLCAPNLGLKFRVPGSWVSGALGSWFRLYNSGCQASGFQGSGFPGTYSHELLELAPKSALLSAPWVQLRHSSRFQNNCLAEMWSSSKEGSNLRLMDCCITQLQARGVYRRRRDCLKESMKQNFFVSAGRSKTEAFQPLQVQIGCSTP